MDPISKGFVAEMEAFAGREGVPVVLFRKGERKDYIAAEHLKGFTKPEGVLFIGKGQEKTPVFRTERRRNAQTGVSYPWLVRTTAMVNYFYVYCVDFREILSRVVDRRSMVRLARGGERNHREHGQKRNPYEEKF
jgi:hypothetical protein